MGKSAFGNVFTDAPVDSSQIIHPDRYFAHIKPSKPDLPNLTLKDAGGEIAEGTVGEFDHRILLKQYAGEAAAESLAPHLRGAQYKVLA
jgi:hypothetical protein